MNNILVKMSGARAAHRLAYKGSISDLLASSGVPYCTAFQSGTVAWLWPNSTSFSEPERMEFKRVVTRWWQEDAPRVSAQFDWRSVKTSTPRPAPTLWWRYESELMYFLAVVESPSWEVLLSEAEKLIQQLNELASDWHYKSWSSSELEAGDNSCIEWWATVLCSATMGIESAYNPLARFPYGSNGVNSTAVGIAQVVNATAKGLAAQISASQLCDSVFTMTGVRRTSIDVGDALTKHRGSASIFAPGLLTVESIVCDSFKSITCLADKIKAMRSYIKKHGPQTLITLARNYVTSGVDVFDLALVATRYAYYAGAGHYPKINSADQREANLILRFAYKGSSKSTAVNGISYPKV